MINIDFLKNYPEVTPALAHIWRDVLGKIWMPEMGIEDIEFLYDQELQGDMPLTLIALYNDIPVGSCTVQLKDEIRPDLSPWIGDLVVDARYQRQGIGRKLMDAAVLKAKDLGFEKLYLFAFDSRIASYYEHLGWMKIGDDQFKSHPVTVMELVL